MKLLSLIVPAYNDAKYLPSCLSSISSQLSSDVELLIIDDGSNDATPLICREYSKDCDNIHVITHQRRQGASAARNTGLANARSRYVAFIDSDDQLHPGAISVILGAVTNGLYAEVIVGQWSGQSHTANNREMFRKNSFERVKSDEFIGHLNKFEYLPDVCWHYVIERQFLIRNRLTFIDAKVGEDQVFVAGILCLASEILLVPELFYWHRSKPGGLKSSRDVETTFGYIKVLEKLFEFCELPELTNLKQAFLKRRVRHARGVLLAHLTLLDSIGLKELCGRIRDTNSLIKVMLGTNNISPEKFRLVTITSVIN